MSMGKMEKPLKRVTIALVGAGLRGEGYAAYAQNYPDDMEVVAVVDPNPDRREKIKKQYDLQDEMCFLDWNEFFALPKLADAVFICTQDKQHYEPALKALESGYHVLLEKPMSPDPVECIDLGQKALQYNRIFSICHVLRYAPFFATLKRMIEEDQIGKLVSITHSENVGYWHQAHSFVRGNWSKKSESSPMILAKSCHDLDILLWLVGDDCTHVSSFGSLSYFQSGQAPKGAPLRCTDGCPVSETCEYYAPKLYLTDDVEWPTSAVSNDSSYEARLKALHEGPYGRCVFHCDNDVVDHQVVNLQFANDVTVAFSMSAFTRDVSRTIKLMGTKGEIRGAMEKNEIEWIRFDTGESELISMDQPGGHVGHGGGDYALVGDFLERVRSGTVEVGLTSADRSVQSHLMAFAAEQSRLDKRVISMDEFVSSFQA